MFPDICDFSQFPDTRDSSTWTSRHAVLVALGVI